MSSSLRAILRPHVSAGVAVFAAAHPRPGASVPVCDWLARLLELPGVHRAGGSSWSEAFKLKETHEG